MAGLLRPVMRKTYAQMDRYALDWAAANERVAETEGPLWVVLGDSAAQGVGTPAHDRGYVGVIRQRLTARTGQPWRVLNLSRSGARTREVLEVQWPLVKELAPDLLTSLIGGNDAVWTPLDDWLRDIDDLTAALPKGAIVSTVSRGVRERKTRVANERIRERAAEHGLRLADVWWHTGPPYRGLYFDGFHPNEEGYLQWVEALDEALTGV